MVGPGWLVLGEAAGICVPSNAENIERHRLAFRATTLITSRRSAGVAQAWFQDLNPSWGMFLLRGCCARPNSSCGLCRPNRCARRLRVGLGAYKYPVHIPSTGSIVANIVASFIHHAVQRVVVGGTYAVINRISLTPRAVSRLVWLLYSEVDCWRRANQQRIRTMRVLTLVFCVALYLVCVSFTAPLPPDGTPRFLFAGAGLMLAATLIYTSLERFLDRTQRAQVASWNWKTAARLGDLVGNHPRWQSFSQIVESRWVPTGLLAVNIALAVFWPSIYMQHTIAGTNPRTPQWYVLVPLLYPVFLAFMTTLVIGFSGVVRKVYRNQLYETFGKGETDSAASWFRTFPTGLNYTFGATVIIGLAALCIQELHLSWLSIIFNTATIAALAVWSVWVCIATYHAERLYGPLIYLTVAVGVWTLENILLLPSLAPITSDGWAGLGINVTVAASLFAVRLITLMQSGHARARCIQAEMLSLNTKRLPTAPDIRAENGRRSTK